MRSYLLALLLLTGAGCGRQPEPEVVFAYPASTHANTLYGAAMEAFRRAHPEVKARLLPITGADYYGKVLVLAAAREAPDVMWMGQGFGEFAERGIFLDIEDRVRQEPALAPEQVLPEVVDWYRLAGRLHGYPVAVDMDFIAYDEDRFRAAGLPPPPDGWTLAEFLHAARRLTRDEDGDGQPEVWGFRGLLEFAPFGAALLTADRKQANVATPEMVTALQFSRDLVARWRVSPPPAPQYLERQDAVLAFQARRAAMILTHTWQLPDLRGKLAGRRWDIAPPPTAARRAHWASSQGFCISRDTRRPGDAWKLLRFLLVSDALWPVAARSYPVRRDLAARLLRTNRQRPYRLSVLQDAIDALHPYPRVPNLTELLAEYQDACERVYNGRAAPEAAMRSAARAMNVVLARRH